MNARPYGPLTWLLTACTAVGQLGISMYAPTMPAIAGLLATSEGLVQVTLSIYLIVFAVSQLILGPLSDRFGRRRVLLAGFGIFVFGSVACALSTTIEALIASRAVQAFGACAGVTVGRAVVRDLFAREEAAKVFSIMAMAFAIAPAVSPIIGGYLHAAFDWHAPFLFLAAFGVAILVSILAKLPETNTNPNPMATDPAQLLASFRELMASRIYVGFTLPGMMFLGGMLTMHASLPFLLIQTLGVAPEHYGWLTLSTVLAFFAGAAFSTRMVPRLGVDRAMRIALATQVLSTLLFLGSALLVPMSVTSVLAPMMVWVFGMAIAFPASMAGAMAPFPHMAGAAAALLGCLQMSTGALGSVIVANMQDGTLLPPAVILTVFTAAGVSGFVTLDPERAARSARSARTGV